MNVLFRSVLLGLATGGRSSLGVAAVLLSSANRAPRLGSQPVKLAAAAAVAGELTVDKLPMTPSRLEPPGQLARALSGLVGGGWLAARSSGPRSRIVLAGLTGAAAAWAGTRAGASWRAGAAGRIGSDWPGAVAEDLACLALARTAVHTR